ncbi:MAG: sulfotransferase family 2 domain-containing protein [Terricaulis sp.]
MIISHQHRFVFTAIPKTGTHSIRRALREHLGPDDEEQVGLFVQKRLMIPELAALGHGHLSLAQIRPFLGETVFAAYFKFAFVRNPFDRFVSYCAFMTREDGEFARQPKEVMRRILFEERPIDHLLFVPQHLFVTDAAGRSLADAFGRVEDMQTSYDAFCQRLNLPTTPLEKVNSSRRGDYRGYYEPALVDGVAALYQRDLDLFDYAFE